MKIHSRLMLIGVVVAIIVWLAVLLLRLNSHYAYDVSANYDYYFSNAQHVAVQFNYANGDIDISSLPKGWNTAFIKLDVESTLLGQVLQPSIVLSDGETIVEHDLERGARGVRYINISNFFDSKRSVLSTTIRRFTLKGDVLEFVTFENKKNDNDRMLVISPHPDDAEIAAFTLYSRNKLSYVITVTAGEGGPKKTTELAMDAAQYGLQKGELRVWNSIAIPLMGGVTPERALNLGYFDSTLEDMYRDKSLAVASSYADARDTNAFRRLNISPLLKPSRGQANWKSLVDDFKHILAETKPNIIVTPYPSLDTHWDHKVSTYAVLEAIRALKLTSGLLYLYSNHYSFDPDYPRGDIGTAKSLPPHNGTPIYFRSIYSHPVSGDEQVDKLYALEAMHDMRPDSEWRTVIGSFKLFAKALKDNMLGFDPYHIRRAIRSNELFFVIPVSEVHDDEVYKKLLELTE